MHLQFLQVWHILLGNPETGTSRLEKVGKVGEKEKNWGKSGGIFTVRRGRKFRIFCFPRKVLIWLFCLTSVSAAQFYMNQVGNSRPLANGEGEITVMSTVCVTKLKRFRTAFSLVPKICLEKKSFGGVTLFLTAGGISVVQRLKVTVSFAASPCTNFRPIWSI